VGGNMETGRGVCNICGQDFSKRGILRHLKACKSKDQKLNGEENKNDYRLLKLELKKDKDAWTYIYLRNDLSDDSVEYLIKDIWFDHDDDIDVRKKVDIKVCEESIDLNSKEDFILGAYGFEYDFDSCRARERKEATEAEIVKSKPNRADSSTVNSNDESNNAEIDVETVGKVESLLNVYGIINRKALFKILEFQGCNLSEDELENTLKMASEMDFEIEYVEGGYYKIPSIDNPKLYVENELYKTLVYKLLPSQMLDKKAIIKYMRNIRAVKDFENYLERRYELSDEHIGELIEKIIKNIRTSVYDFDLMFEESFGDLKIEREFERKMLKEKYMEMAVNIPLWILKGHSIAESDMVFGTKLNKYTKKENSEVYSCTTKKKIGRNEPCPCGSGKKFKKCCGK
jgi:hypothetical protein